MCGSRRFKRRISMMRTIERRIESKHQVELVHVETQFLMDETDILDNRRNMRQMLTGQGRRHLFGMRITRQKTQVILRLLEPAPATSRRTVAFM